MCKLCTRPLNELYWYKLRKSALLTRLLSRESSTSDILAALVFFFKALLMFWWSVTWHFSASSTRGLSNYLILLSVITLLLFSSLAAGLDKTLLPWLGPKSPWRMAGALGDRPGLCASVF